MKLLKFVKILGITTILVSVNAYSYGQKQIVKEKVKIPLQDPEGTNYSAKTKHRTIGFVKPILNTNEANSLFWNTYGVNIAFNRQKALNKRIGIGTKLQYNYVRYGKNTNDSIGNSFFSEKKISYQHFISAGVFTRVFLGDTYYQPSLDLGASVGYANRTINIEHGKYVLKKVDGALKYTENSTNAILPSVFAKLNIQKMYLAFTHYFNPLLKPVNNEMLWQNQVEIGFRL